MRKTLPLGLVFMISIFLGGCWVAHVAHDRPELRANVGRSAVLTEAYCLLRDPGGRLHLEKDGVPTGFVLVEELPIGSVLRIKDVVYRVSDPGRHDYYVIEIATASGPVAVEVSAADRNRLAWRYEEKG